MASALPSIMHSLRVRLIGASNMLRHPSDQLLISVAEKLAGDWRRLGIHLGLNHSDISNLDEQQFKDHQYKIFHMLLSWKQRLSSNTDGYLLLKSCLHEIGRSDLAELVEAKQLEEYPVHHISSSEDIRKYTKDILKNTYENYRIPNTSNGGVNFNFAELYTEPILSKNGAVPVQLKGHIDLLGMRHSDGNLQCKRILVRGPRGCGKTTLFQAVSHSWYKRNGSPCSLASRYDLLFSIDLTKVSSDDELADVVFKDLPTDSRVSRDGLKSYIEENQTRVAVLIDGLDQLTCCGNRLGPETVPEYFLKLIFQRVLDKSLVIVASRTLMKRLGDVGLYQVVDVRGFSKEGVASYVKKFFIGREVNAQFLMDVLEGYSSDLRDFSTSPNVIRSLCVLLLRFPEGAGFPQGLPELYDCILDAMIQRHREDICLSGNGRISYFFKKILKSIDPGGLFPPFHNPVPVRVEHRRRFLCDIGKVAARGLLAEQEIQVFEESEFSRARESLAVARSLGILIQDKETSTMVRFCHRSFQEYCAGKYCQNLGTTKPAKFRKKIEFVDGKVRSGRELISMCRFCCGGSIDSTDLIMKYTVPLMVEGNMNIGTSLDGRIALACHTECPSDTFRKLLEPHLIQNGEIQIEYSSSGSRFLRDMCHFLFCASEDDRFKDELLTVHTLTITCGLNTYCIQTVAKMVRHFRDLQSVSVINNSDQAPVLIETDVAVHPACDLISKLHCQHQLSRLTINNCRLNSKCLTLIMRELSGLQYLDVSNNQSIDWSESLRLYEVQKLPRLSVLKVTESGLSRDDVGGFLSLLQQQPDLVELYLDCNDLNTAGLRCIMCELHRMEKLEVICAKRALQDRMILPHDEVIELIVPCSKLKVLDINRWELANESSGAQIIEAAVNRGDLTLIFNERAIYVDETGNISLLELS